MKKASLLIIENNARKTRVMPLTKGYYRIGRSGHLQNTSDIALDSDIVSREHGEIYFQAPHWVYRDLKSSNGTFVDGRHLYGDSSEMVLSDGSFIRIDGDRDFTKCFSEKGVLMVFCEGDYKNQKWLNYPLDAKLKDYVHIGRDISSDIVLNEPSVSGRHGIFFRKGDRLFYRDVHSSPDTTLNGEVLAGEREIIDKDVLMIGTVKMIYTNGMLFYTDKVSGTHLSVRHLTKTVKDSENKLHKKTILNDVSVDIASSELVAILGTSGAGKSTFVNSVIGYEQATSGEVLIGGVNLYSNKKSVRKQIGYVPQFDLLRGNLSVESTLRYIAKLRLPKDTTKAE
ncbi:MAG: FHA domain-containing protein, partial [Eubacteriaceae bacterium]|nr:FHA domain-containing protein [Eubacteriaceae bacterium]